MDFASQTAASPATDTTKRPPRRLPEVPPANYSRGHEEYFRVMQEHRGVLKLSTVSKERLAKGLLPSPKDFLALATFGFNVVDFGVTGTRTTAEGSPLRGSAHTGPRTSIFLSHPVAQSVKVYMPDAGITKLAEISGGGKAEVLTWLKGEGTPSLVQARALAAAGIPDSVWIEIPEAKEKAKAKSKAKADARAAKKAQAATATAPQA